MVFLAEKKKLHAENSLSRSSRPFAIVKGTLQFRSCYAASTIQGRCHPVKTGPCYKSPMG